MNRREALRTIGSGGALGGALAIAVSLPACAPTEAPAAIHDPLLDAINDFLAVRSQGRAMPFETEAQINACERFYETEYDARFWRLAHSTMPATTAAGALAALRLVEEGTSGEAGSCVYDQALLTAAMAYLEGRAA